MKRSSGRDFGFGRLRLTALATIPLLAAACASPDAIQRPCCYEGELTLAPLRDVRFVMDDGSELPFEKVFPGFYEQDRAITTPFPFRRVTISGLVYDVLSVVFPVYDANKNGIMEEPELAVLYLREGALGMGFEVSYLKVNGRVHALQTSKADVGGLVSYVNANRPGMSKDARALFDEIDHLATQIRRRGQEAADQSFLGP